MYSLSPEIINDFTNDGTITKIWIYMSNGSSSVELRETDIETSSVKLVDEIETENDLSFIGCNSAQFSFNFEDRDIDLRGYEIEVFYGTDKYPHCLPIFKGKIKDQTNLTHEDELCSITAYDAINDLYELNASDWYNSISFPVTLGDFRDSFMNFVGLTQNVVSFPLDSMMIDKTIDGDSIYAIDILKSICQLNSVYGHITRTGEFEYLSPARNSLASYHIEQSMYESCDFNSIFKINRITKVIIRLDSNDVGVYYGSGDNIYAVEDNFLIAGKSAEELRDVARIIYDSVYVTYTPVEINCIGLPWLDVCDNFDFDTDKHSIESIIFKREMSGVEFITSTFTSEGNQKRSETATSIASELRRLKGKYNKFESDIEGTRREIGDIERGLTHTIEETASGLTEKIQQVKLDSEEYTNVTIKRSIDEISTRMESMQKEIDGDSTMITVYEEPTLYNYPAMDWTTSLIVYDETDPKVRYMPIPRATEVMTPEQLEDYRNYLRQYRYEEGQIEDIIYQSLSADIGFRLALTDDDKSSHSRVIAYWEEQGLTYRMRQTDGVWGWVSVADSDFGLTIQKISEVKQTLDGVDTLVKRIEETYFDKNEFEATLKVHADYIKSTVKEVSYTKDEINGKGWQTKSEVESSIKQSADSIITTVKGFKYLTDADLKNPDGTQMFVKKTEFKSEIDVNKDSITSLVKATSYTKDEIDSNAWVKASEFSSKITQNSDSIKSVVKEVSYTKSESNDKYTPRSYVSQIEQTAREISAKVSETGGNASFSWYLKADGFYLSSANRQVFVCNSRGVTVDGYVTTNTLNTTVANIQRLVSEKADIRDLEAQRAQIENLSASFASIQYLVASKVDATYVDAKVANVSTLIATKASISDLNAVNATVSKKLTTTELQSKIAALSFITTPYFIRFTNTASGGATIIQVPKGDGSGTMINITNRDLLKACGKI